MISSSISLPPLSSCSPDTYAGTGEGRTGAHGDDHHAAEELAHLLPRLQYPGTIIYAFGAYAFYRIIMAAVNLIRRRGRDDPLFAAARCLNLATAIVSVFSLQTALLSAFGTEKPAFRLIANAASGTAVCAAILLMAVMMVRTGSRILRSLQEQPETGGLS